MIPLGFTIGFVGAFIGSCLGIVPLVVIGVGIFAATVGLDIARDL